VHRAWIVNGVLALSTGLSLTAVYFVGGPFLFLLVLLGLCLASGLTKRGFGGPSAVLLGQVLGLTYVFLAGAVVIPVLRRMPLLKEQFFTTTQLAQPEYARSYVYSELVEITQLTTISLLVIPILIILLLNLRALHLGWQEIKNFFKKENGVEGNRGIVLSWLIGSTPVFVAAAKKLRDPYEYVVATMSGDGRNFFLIVENMRVTARPTQISQILGQGDFLPGIASHLSSALGAHGRLDFRDQFAIAAVYTYMSMIIVASLTACVFALISRYKKLKKLDNNNRDEASVLWCIAPLLCIVGFLVSNYGPVVNEIFRSGFFSLYGAYALIAAFLALNTFENRPTTFVAKIAVFLLISITYSLAAGLILASLLPGLFARFETRHFTLPIAIVTAVCSAVVLNFQPWGQLLETLQSRVSLEGAIIPLDTNLPRNILIAAGVLYLLLRPKHILSQISRDAALVAISGLVLRTLITNRREKIGLEGYGYYGAKNDYMIYFAAVFLVASVAVFSLGAALIHILQRRRNPTSIHRVAYFGLAVIWAYSAFTIGNLIPTSNTFLSRSGTWIQPRATSVEFATSTWRRGDFLYLSDNDPGEARILNFWIPYFWRDPGWNWVYWEFTTDPESVCTLLEKDDVEVVASSETIRNAIQDRCGNLLK
jgi:hypothetical protein